MYSKEKNDLQKICAASERKMRRRVFMCNTHLINVMNQMDEYFSLLEDIFNIFSKDKSIILIWRPHPLIEETIKAFNINKYRKYRRFIEKICGLDNIIYDDTSDLYRTITLSDAYIGDKNSSIVALYGITGKPMYIFDLENCCTRKPLAFIETLATVIVDNQLWQFSNEYNALFRMDTLIKENLFCCSLSAYPRNQECMFMKAKYHNKRIFFLPCTVDEMLVYNIENNKCQYISFEFVKFRDCNGAIVNGKLWLLPMYYAKYYYSIDLFSLEVESINLEYEKLSFYNESMADTPLIVGECVVNDMIWRVSLVSPIVVCYQLQNDTISMLRVESSNEAYEGIAYDGKYFWLLPLRNGSIVKWSNETNEVIELAEYPKEVNKNSTALFQDIVFASGFIWLIPYHCNYLIKINIESNHMVCIDCHVDNYYRTNKMSLVFSSCDIQEPYLYLFSNQCHVIVKVNMENSIVEKIVNSFPDIEERIDYFTHWHRDNNDNYCPHIYQDNICTLESFIQKSENHGKYMEEQKQYYKQKLISVDGEYGKKIWGLLKGEL